MKNVQTHEKMKLLKLTAYLTINAIVLHDKYLIISL